jgi:hypothetical protein
MLLLSNYLNNHRIYRNNQIFKAIVAFIRCKNEKSSYKCLVS